MNFEEILILLAAQTGSVVALLEQVPNEPVSFTEEAVTRTRTEDEIIAYTYDEFMKSVADGAQDNDWPLLLPMVKSAVRAMDTIESEIPAVSDFVISGGSKRGWTTWLTAVYDQGPVGEDRVRGIAPIVIDVLNMDRQMEHHFRAYGYWAPAIYPYAQEKIFDRLSATEGQVLLGVVDPFEYRCRLDDLPKLILNSTGDQFFLPDSSQFYFDRLPGENFLSYVPNTSHSLTESFDFDLGGVDPRTRPDVALISWYLSILDDQGERPDFDWTFEDDGVIRVTVRGVTDASLPEVKFWQADTQAESVTGVMRRDFRLERIGAAWTSTTLTAEAAADGNPNARDFVATLETPEEGWRAGFVQLLFDNASVVRRTEDILIQLNNPLVPPSLAPELAPDIPFTMTTSVRVVPERPLDGITEPAIIAHPNQYPDFTGEDAGTITTLGSGADSIPVITVSGTPGQMGAQYGALLSSEIRSGIPAFVAAAQAANPALSDEVLDDAYAAFIEAFESVELNSSDRFVDEIQGIALGAVGDDFGEFAGLRDNLERANMIVALEALSGNAVFATNQATMPAARRNSNTTQLSASLDWSLDLGLQANPVVVLYVPELGTGVPHFSVTFAGLSGVMTGINVMGVSTAITSQGSEAGDPALDSLLGSASNGVLRRLLNDATDINEAESVLNRFRTFLRQEILVSDAGKLFTGLKAQTSELDDVLGLQLFSDRGDEDVFNPPLFDNLLFSGPNSAIFGEDGVSVGPVQTILLDDYGMVDDVTADDVMQSLGNENNLINVIYVVDLVGGRGATITVSYAEGEEPAFMRNMVEINIPSFLP